jgi:hypothetical protein
MSSKYSYPIICIRPGAIYGYSSEAGRSAAGAFEGENPGRKNLEAKSYQGKITPSAVRKIRKYANLLLAISVPKQAISFKTGKPFTFRLNFITLTLSSAQGKTSDADIKKHCLKPFLRKAKSQFGLKSYIWRAERQKNGNLHFHIVSDCYMPVTEVRDLWNTCQATLGFIQQFHKVHGHDDPNSTDVRAVYAEEDLGKYISKYMSKDKEQDDTIQGRVWDCSANLKAKIKCEIEGVGKDYSEWLAVRKRLKSKKVAMEYIDYFAGSPDDILKELPVKWQQLYQEYLYKVRNYEPSAPVDRKPMSRPVDSRQKQSPRKIFPPELFPEYTGNSDVIKKGDSREEKEKEETK